jgi:hypothetical protein
MLSDEEIPYVLVTMVFNQKAVSFDGNQVVHPFPTLSINERMGDFQMISRLSPLTQTLNVAREDF